MDVGGVTMDDILNANFNFNQASPYRSFHDNNVLGGASIGPPNNIQSLPDDLPQLPDEEYGNVGMPQLPDEEYKDNLVPIDVLNNTPVEDPQVINVNDNLYNEPVDDNLCGAPTKKGKPCTRHGRSEYGGKCKTHKDDLHATVHRKLPKQDPQLKAGEEFCGALNYWGPKRGKRCRRKAQAKYNNRCNLHKNYNQPDGLYRSPEERIK